MEPGLAEKMKEKEKKHIKNILWQSLSLQSRTGVKNHQANSTGSIQMGPVLHRRASQPHTTGS